MSVWTCAVVVSFRRHDGTGAAAVQNVQPGRLHGSFTCYTCAAADRALRRNLGERSEVQEFSREETYTFFRKVKEAKEESLGKRLQWQTLRATLIHHATQRQITEFKSDVECAALPLSVYLAQGWEESVVKNCPTVFNEVLGESSGAA